MFDFVKFSGLGSISEFLNFFFFRSGRTCHTEHSINQEDKIQEKNDFSLTKWSFKKMTSAQQSEVKKNDSSLTNWSLKKMTSA